VVHLATDPPFPDDGSAGESVAPGPEELRQPKVGLVVARSVGNAVTRNRVRRRLRHLAGERIGRLPAGSTLVLRALPAAAESSYAALGRDLDSALRRVGVPTAPGGHRTARRR
jgi:ribonuclease P protein component